MKSYRMTISPTRKSTRLLLKQGKDELLRAVLPPAVRETAAARLLEGLSLWLDTRLCVALCVGESAASSCLGLTDEDGVGTRGWFYDAEVIVPPKRRPRRTHRSRGSGSVGQLKLWGVEGGKP